MRKAVVRMNVDPGGSMSAAEIATGIDRLQADGHSVRWRGTAAELVLTLDGPDAETARTAAAEACEHAFGTAPRVGAITFVSRGTDEDALGVIERFGVDGSVARVEENGEEIAVFTFAAADRERIPESRLRTALEAALNCEIRIEYA